MTWTDTVNGGLIQQTGLAWFARPCNRVGMNTILVFDNEHAARNYADTPTDWTGWGRAPRVGQIDMGDDER